MTTDIKKIRTTIKGLIKPLGLMMFLLVWFTTTMAQDTTTVKIPQAQRQRERAIIETADSLTQEVSDLKIVTGNQELTITVPTEKEVKKAIEKSLGMPDPKKALWLAIVFPGGGQIYNRKYWKLPIIYGGFLGCMYALDWNNTMYNDYSKAYIDIMDNDPNTNSYENFIPRGYNINTNLSRVQDMFRRKKNYYRRYRDLSMFLMIGVYAISIIDAYVDAELSNFDIGRDLSMKVRPSVIYEKTPMAQRLPMTRQSYGVECSISF